MRYTPHILTIERELRERITRGNVEGAIQYAQQAVKESYWNGFSVGQAARQARRPRRFLFRLFARRRE